MNYNQKSHIKLLKYSQDLKNQSLILIWIMNFRFSFVKLLEFLLTSKLKII